MLITQADWWEADDQAVSCFYVWHSFEGKALKQQGTEYQETGEGCNKPLREAVGGLDCVNEHEMVV